MAFALPAAATAVAAAAPAAAAKATLMATLKSVAFKAITNLAISAAMSALQPQVGGQGGRTFEWTIDPDAPIPFAAGRVGVAGSVVHRDTFGPDLMYYGIPAVLSGAGPITGYDSVQADDYTVTFDGTGKAITSTYAGELWFKSTLGNQPDVALSSPAGLKHGATLPGWTSQHKLSGKAAYMVVMGENSKGSAFPTGEIKPLITFRGLKGWDPRLDSTYPGGSGSCRLDNPATWVYLTNPILWALKWSLGLWEGPTGKGAPQVDHQVGGIGAKLSGIDVPAFVAAANVADANGWTVSAYPNTDDDKHQVLEAFLQAGGAIYSQRAGKISCIQRAAPRTSIVTISAADTAGPLEIDTAASRIDRINTIRPRFWSPAHRWQMTAMDEITAASYQTEDGGKRTRGIDYPFVSNAKQAGQLAALQIANTREGIAGVIPLKPHLQRIRPGDAFTITEPGFVLNGLKCLCLNTDYDPATGVVRVSFVSETDQKYPFALGQDPNPPEPQVLTPVDPMYVAPPTAAEWSFNGATFVDNGLSIPAIVFTGDVDNATAEGVLFEYRPETSSGWSMAGEEGPLVARKEVTSVTPGTRYYGSVRYRRGSNFSERLTLGPATAGVFSLEAQPYARDLAKGGFASTTDMPKSTSVTYSTPNGSGQLRVTYPATGTSAYFGWNVGRPGAKANVIRARVRAAADPITAAHWDGRLTYATAALAHSLTAGRMASLAFPGEITAGKWRVLEWEADDLTDYLTSTIDAVRFYLLKPGAPPIDVDWLEAGYREGATANTGKLADQDEVDFDEDIVGPGKPISGAGKIYADAVTTNTTPGGYVTLLPTGGVRLEIKDSAALGNARASGNAVVQTDVPASGWAGAVQVMRTPTQGSFKRSANTATSWRGWTRAYDEEQKPLFGYDLEETPGVLATVAAYKTGVGTSAFVNNQGKLATQDAVDFDADVGGPNKPVAGAGKVYSDAPTLNGTPLSYRTLMGVTGGVRVEVKDAAALGNARASGNTIVVTEVPPGSTGNVTGVTQVMRTPSQGSFRRTVNTTTSWRGWTKDYGEEQRPIFGLDLEETAGVLATVANFKTNQGTSAFVNNQGKLATQDAVDFDADVGGPNKPLPNAGKIYDDAPTVNTTPNGYLALLPNGGIRVEIKNGSAVGNARVAGAGVVTTEVRPGSINDMVQVMRTRTEGSFRRGVNSGTSWRGWVKDYGEEQKPIFGLDLEETAGVLATVANFKTNVGTAAFIANQGNAATGSDADYKTALGYASGTNGTPLDGSYTSSQPPGFYRGLGINTYFERKANSIAGGSTGLYGVLTTYVSDSRADRPIQQKFVSDTATYTRRSTGTADTTWSAWYQTYDEDRKPYFGADLLESSGGPAATLAGFKTNQGTAAYLNNQGKLATQDGVDFESDVGGPNKPVAGAGQIFDGSPTVNSPPSYYLGLFPQGGIRAELKMPASLGNTRGGTVASVTTTEARAGSYVGMVQIMRTPTSGVFKRDAASNTAWFGWVKSYDEDVKPRFGSDLLNASGATATDAAYQTSQGTSAFVYNQGDLTTRDNVYFGSNFVRETNGGTAASLANFKTNQGTAAYINNQGNAATGSDADYKTAEGYASGLNGNSLTGNYGDDPLPSFYRNRGIATYNERKAASLTGGSTSQYGTLRTEVTDTRTDRPIIQTFIFYDGLTYQRHSVSADAAWSNWQKFYGQGQKPAFGDGIPRNAASGNGVVLTPSRPLSPVSGYANSRIAVAATTAKFGDGATISLPSGTITGLSSDTLYWVFRRFSNSSYVVTASSTTAANYKTDDDYLYIGVQPTAATSGGSYSPPPPPPPGGGGGLDPYAIERL